ncbi:hypothetical protein HZA97_03065 [Candidatus Woesearchaeota archaeon]|nr:hypothetical protein [Candidatus Woesearchaeota archaeon]
MAAEKYYFMYVLIIVVLTFIISWLSLRTKPGIRVNIILVNNFLMLLFFLLSSLMGVSLIFGYKIQSFDFKFWHVITGQFLVYSILFHIILHWAVWKSYLRKIF